MTLQLNMQAEIFDDDSGGSIKVEPCDEGNGEIQLRHMHACGEVRGSITITRPEAAMMIQALRAVLRALNYNPKDET